MRTVLVAVPNQLLPYQTGSTISIGNDPNYDGSNSVCGTLTEHATEFLDCGSDLSGQYLFYTTVGNRCSVIEIEAFEGTFIHTQIYNGYDETGVNTTAMTDVTAQQTFHF